MTTWFITGASRGLGRALLETALQRGHSVLAAVRDIDDLAAYIDDSRVDVVSVDVRHRHQIDHAVHRAVERFGGVDVLINNAGYGLLGPVEETSDKEAREVFDVNFFGLLAVTQAVLPVMRAARHGRVINVSSVGGFAALPGSGIYAATKFAVEAISEALRDELADTSISVHIIEPGAFRTDFLDQRSIRRTQATPIDAYRGTVHDGQPAFLAQSGEQLGDPVRAASAIADVASIGHPPFRLQLGEDCVARVEAKLDFVRNELNQWRPLSLSTSFDAAEPGS
jgi:NAD(P)-dependent dehydrogenase (short-subunit alcohol dehydrogenase family)